MELFSSNASCVAFCTSFVALVHSSVRSVRRSESVMRPFSNLPCTLLADSSAAATISPLRAGVMTSESATVMPERVAQ